MGHKIATIVLSHDCDEKQCHLKNEEQSQWLTEILPTDKLDWNWKLVSIKVFDISKSESDTRADNYISNIIDKNKSDEHSE